MSDTVVLNSEQELTGGKGRPLNSARAGFLPVPLMRAPLAAFDGIAVYVKGARPTVGDDVPSAPEESRADGESEFQLYCAPGTEFTASKRALLAENGIDFLYIKMADHSQFREQTAAHLEQSAGDEDVAVSERSALIYETSIELINELLDDFESISEAPALQQISRSVTTLVLGNEDAFAHLLAVSHHDFYTATHLVNVATWMVPLAHEMGYKDPETLDLVCRAGILHDVGKLTIPDEILNKTDKLSEDEWAIIRDHPESGYQRLVEHGNVNELVLRITREHHERLDGKGYPFGLKGEDIHPLSRICAVVDSFDAMTAFRPYKTRTMGIPEVMDILKNETPEKYDPAVMAAWERLLGRAEQTRLMPDTRSEDCADSPDAGSAKCRRIHERKEFVAQGRIDPVFPFTPTGQRRLSLDVTVHNISRSGLGFLCRNPLQAGEEVRVGIQVRGWEDRRFEGQVVRCCEYGDDWWEIGLIFTRVIN